MAFYFESGKEQTLTIPMSLADSYLSVATGVQIKVMLCLLRFEGMPLTEDMIATHCRVDKDDVKEAIRFWCDQRMLSRRGSTLCLSVQTAVQAAELPKYTADEILSLTEENPDFAALVEAAQGVMGKIFNHNDLNILFGIYDNLGFSEDLIIQLLGFCAAAGKKSFRYIEKVAIDWHDRGIDSFEKADNYIRYLEKLAGDEARIASMFGIEGRALSKKEKEHIARWRQEQGHSLDMVEAAYEICVDTKGKLSFAYINGILSDWHQKGYKAPAEAAAAPKPGKTEAQTLSDFEKAAFAKLSEEEI